MITSRNNPIVKLARKLKQQAGRRDSTQFLIEGISLVSAALNVGWPVDLLLYCPDLLVSEYARKQIAEFQGRVETVSVSVLESIANRENPQGILAIARRRQLGIRASRVNGHAVAMVSPQDPGNVGTTLRTLEATGGVSLYLLDGGVDPYHPTAVRAAMGAGFTVPVIEASFEAFDEWRRSVGIALIGTSARAAMDFHELKPSLPWILLMGNEQKGLSEQHKETCDFLVGIPMRGRISSLNLGVAAGILLYAYAPVEGQMPSP